MVKVRVTNLHNKRSKVYLVARELVNGISVSVTGHYLIQVMGE